jgi:hypothetical protein
VREEASMLELNILKEGVLGEWEWEWEWEGKVKEMKWGSQKRRRKKQRMLCCVGFLELPSFVFPRRKQIHAK